MSFYNRPFQSLAPIRWPKAARHPVICQTGRCRSRMNTIALFNPAGHSLLQHAGNGGDCLLVSQDKEVRNWDPRGRFRPRVNTVALFVPAGRSLLQHAGNGGDWLLVSKDKDRSTRHDVRDQSSPYLHRPKSSLCTVSHIVTTVTHIVTTVPHIVTTVIHIVICSARRPPDNQQCTS